jgi:hypothetical protein
MNESAFPIPSHVNAQGETHDVEFTGMTLRDYFAAKAMQAIITNHKLEDCDDDVVAFNAYQLADFMLEARIK